MAEATVVVEIAGGDVQPKIGTDEGVVHVPCHKTVAFFRRGNGLSDPVDDERIDEGVAVIIFEFVAQTVIAFFVDVDETVVDGFVKGEGISGFDKRLHVIGISVADFFEIDKGIQHAGFGKGKAVDGAAENKLFVDKQAYVFDAVNVVLSVHAVVCFDSDADASPCGNRVARREGGAGFVFGYRQAQGCVAAVDCAFAFDRVEGDAADVGLLGVDNGVAEEIQDVQRILRVGVAHLEMQVRAAR